jgi:hypothetical protein
MVNNREKGGGKRKEVFFHHRGTGLRQGYDPAGGGHGEKLRFGFIKEDKSL